MGHGCGWGKGNEWSPGFDNVRITLNVVGVSVQAAIKDRNGSGVDDRIKDRWSWCIKCVWNQGIELDRGFGRKREKEKTNFQISFKSRVDIFCNKKMTATKKSKIDNHEIMITYVQHFL